MSETYLGDAPGNRFYLPNLASHALVASNGANARIRGVVGPFLQTIRVTSVWWQPEADNVTVGTATTSFSYRRLSLYNGGAAGTATATASRLASLNLTASMASLSINPMTIVATGNSVASGATLYFSQETVGAAQLDGTVLQAGQFCIAYELL